VNDEIQTDIGAGANGVAAGSKINQAINTTTVVGGLDAIIDHLLEMKGKISTIEMDVKEHLLEMKGKISTIEMDVKEAHIERASLINTVNGLLETIDDIRQGIYPRWLQALMITMAAIMITLTMLIWIKANALNDINWLAVTFGVSIALLAAADAVILVLFYRFQGEIDKRLHTMMIDIINRIDAAKYQKDKS